MCGKKCFSKREAEHHIKNPYHKKEMRMYFHPECRAYHLTTYRDSLYDPYEGKGRIKQMYI